MSPGVGKNHEEHQESWLLIQWTLCSSTDVVSLLACVIRSPNKAPCSNSRISYITINIIKEITTKISKRTKVNRKLKGESFFVYLTLR